MDHRFYYEKKSDLIEWMNSKQNDKNIMTEAPAMALCWKQYSQTIKLNSKTISMAYNKQKFFAHIYKTITGCD